MARFLECCCGSVQDVLEAQKGGASRIELCERLDIGGVTPSEELILSVLSVAEIPVNVLVRPATAMGRPLCTEMTAADFVYSEAEIREMEEAICFCRRASAGPSALRGRVNGVVIGALTPGGSVDMTVCRRLMAAAGRTAPAAVAAGAPAAPVAPVSPVAADAPAAPVAAVVAADPAVPVATVAAGAPAATVAPVAAESVAVAVPAAAERPLDVTFHRAFDVCADPLAAFHALAELGCDTLLTSGHEPDALRGAALIGRLVTMASADSRYPRVMAGCGVRPANIAEIEALSSASAFHSSSHGASGHTESAVVAAMVDTPSEAVI